MSNDPASGGEQPGWHGQQPYPGAYGQHGDQQAYPAGGYGQQAADQPASGYPAGGYGQQAADQPGSAYPGSSYPPPSQQGGYGQAPPPWAAQTAQQPGQQRGGWPGAQPGAAPAGLGPGGAPPHNEAQSFMSALFDFGFNTFATPVVIKVLYILSMVAIALFYVIAVISGFTEGALTGLLVVVGGGIAALLALVYTRVLLELLYAGVRIAEDIRVMRNRQSPLP
jgi:hypothetical protein